MNFIIQYIISFDNLLTTILIKAAHCIVEVKDFVNLP